MLSAARLASEPARQRFRVEARALSRLSHPNVATIHDFGSAQGLDYLVMELIPGQTLSRRAALALPEIEVVRLGVQIAEGLMAAHDQGIVHRDLKPGNIRVTPDGRVKILDFGLAHLRDPDLDLTETAGLGSPLVVGSPPYMSPEQLRGAPVEPLTDIYAAGAVLYEMATGHQAFDHGTPAEVIGAVLNEAPTPVRQRNPAITPWLEAVIHRALDKDPARRQQSARELRAELERGLPGSGSQPYLVPALPSAPTRRGRALWAVALAVIAIGFGSALFWLRPAAPGARVALDSMAVLPFENLSGDPAQEYFADGMTEAITAHLSQLGALRVTSRTSAMQFKGARRSLPEIAGKLGVAAVVEGSVIRQKSRVRITAQLIDARSDNHLWAETFDRDVSDVLELQAEVARSIARQIHLVLTPEESSRLVARRVTPEAYEAYLQGRRLFDGLKAADIQRAIEFYQRALRSSPDYALAYSALADAYLQQGESRPALMRARTAARRALELDPSLAEAHAASALASWLLDWNWVEAEAGFRRATELAPSYAYGHQQYGRYLAARGRFDESIAELRKAERIDPLSPLTSAATAGMMLYARRPGPAQDQLRRVFELQPDFWVAHYLLGLVQSQRGQFGDSVASLQHALEAAGKPRPGVLGDLASLYARSGQRSEALATLAELERVRNPDDGPPPQLALAIAHLGDKDRAFALLEQAMEARVSLLLWMNVDPRFDVLRSDSRFAALVARLGMP